MQKNHQNSRTTLTLRGSNHMFSNLKLLLRINLLVFIAISVLTAALLYINKYAKLEMNVTNVKTLARVAGQSARELYQANNIEALNRLAQTLIQSPGLISIQFRGGENHILSQAQTQVQKDSKDLNQNEVIESIAAPPGTPLGKVVLTYTTDHLHRSAMATMPQILGICVITQLLLSVLLMIVFSSFTKRTIVSPMRDIICSISKMSSSIAADSTRMNKQTARLTRGVDQHDATLKKSIALMAKISEMINQTTEQTRSSDHLVQQATSRTQDGMAVIEEMVTSMERIKASNEQTREMEKIVKKIVQKTGAISDILIKTQFLSVNASIEAAKAGEYGVGFSVVADEVKSLSEASRESAQDIDNYLQDSLKQVKMIVTRTNQLSKEGKEVSEKSLAIFREIFNDMFVVSQSVEKITFVASEQERIVSDMAVSISELGDIANSNNLIAQESEEYALSVKANNKKIEKVIASVQGLLRSA